MPRKKPSQTDVQDPKEKPAQDQQDGDVDSPQPGPHQEPARQPDYQALEDEDHDADALEQPYERPADQPGRAQVEGDALPHSGTDAPDGGRTAQPLVPPPAGRAQQPATPPQFDPSHPEKYPAPATVHPGPQPDEEEAKAISEQANRENMSAGTDKSYEDQNVPTKVIVRCDVDQRRRGGRVFNKGKTVIPIGDITAADLAALQADGVLRVTVV